MLSQLTSLKSDPLDVLLFAVGLRLSQLAKMGDAKFKSLLDNRNFTIQMGSEAEGTARYFSVNNGSFSQHAGEASNPSLTITFKDSMTGVKLMTKGDATAFMMGIQNGDLKMSGDYSLLMWFNQVAKYIVPKVPEQLQPVVDHAKPLLVKAAPVAKDIFAKVQSLLGGNTEPSAKGTSKYFKDVKEDDKTSDTSEKSEGVIDNLKSKVQDVTDTLHEKLDNLGGEAKEKFEDLKATASEKLDDAKVKLDEVKETATDKLADVKEQAQEKIEDVKDTATDKLSDVKEEAAHKLDDAKAKLDDVKDTAADKLADVKADAADKVDDAKAKLEDTKEAAVNKLADVKDDAQAKLADVKTEAADKVDEVKAKLEDTKAQVADKATDVKAQAEDKLGTIKDDAKDKLAEVKDQAAQKLDAAKTADTKPSTESSTPSQTPEEKLAELKAQQASSITSQTQEIEAKHANDEVIAENVVTAAVKNDASPITNITVTRHEEKSEDKAASNDSNSKTESGKPAIVVQDKDGKSYTSK